MRVGRKGTHFGVGVVGGNQEEVADGTHMRKGLHHHVDVVCFSNHVHSHHAWKIVVARGDAVDAIVLVQMLDVLGCVLGVQGHFDIVERRIEDFIIVRKAVESRG